MLKSIQVLVAITTHYDYEDERKLAMQHTNAEGCANKGEIQKFHLHSSSSNEEFLAQDPICN